MKKINKKTRRKALLSTIDREYSLYEIVISTRAGQAKSLGLKNKGHLGVGADADVSIYDLNPKETNLADNPKAIAHAFKNAAYTIKDGEIVVKDGEVV